MRILKRVVFALDWFTERFGKIVSFMIVAMILAIFYEVIMRYFFRAPTIWAHNLSLYLFGASSVLGGGYVLLHREHVRVDIIWARLQPRTQVIVDLITSILFFLFVVMFVWYSWVDLAWPSILRLEPTFHPWGVPIWPFKLTLPVGAFLVLLMGVSKFIRDLYFVVTGRELV